MTSNAFYLLGGVLGRDRKMNAVAEREFWVPPNPLVVPDISLTCQFCDTIGAPSFSTVLHQAAVSTNWRHVAGLIQVPKTLPFVNNASEVLRGIQKLLNSPLGSG